MTTLPDKIVAVHAALDAAGLPHAFGGALALAWCTGQARGTIDIDVNVFVDSGEFAGVLAALPDDITWEPRDESLLANDGQVRLWWAQTPVDVFLDTTDLHIAAARRVRWERFMDRDVPFLACRDLAIFKAFFNRTKDWADLEEMAAAGTLDRHAVAAVLIDYLGADDERVTRLLALPELPAPHT